MTSDFTVDFDNRGMDSNQNDGTDWGEDDGQRKCGRSGLGTGQWFVYARERSRVAILGPSLRPAETLLTENGYQVDRYEFDDETLPDRLIRGQYDVVMIARYSFRAGTISPALRQAIDLYGRQGGSIITEYDGASLFVAAFHGTFAGANTAPDPLGWFRAVIGGGANRGNNTPITQAVPDDPIFEGVADPILGAGSTEFFMWTWIVDDVIPTNLEALATFPGTGRNPFPFQTHTAIDRGRHCGGNVFFGHFDYGDGNPVTAGLRDLVLNMVADAMQPPPPALVEACQVQTRPILMLCGDSSRNVGTFLPLNGPTMRVLNACNPGDTTQAMLVTRSGAGQLDANQVRTYLSRGGIVLTEYDVADEVFNLVFGTDVEQAAGNGSGQCSDEVMPGVQLNPDHQFWRENRFVEGEGGRGCGFDVSAFPSITSLGGWNADTVSLAYRDRGAGRLWLVAADWQDRDNGFEDDSRGLMQWMILHGAEGRHGAPFNRTGPRVDLTEEDVIGGGFVPCYRGEYSETVALEDITAACDDSVLMLACRPVGETTLQVAAMGTRDGVLQDDGNAADAAHQHNGSTWYFNEGRSWGFAGAQQAVARNSCDTNGAGEDTRLCWHTNGGNLRPGWSCGSNRGIGGDWERIVYQRGGGL